MKAIRADKEIGIFKNLLNSKPFDVHKISEAPEVSKCIQHIIKLCLKNGLIKRERKETKNNMKTLVLDLYVTYLHNPDVWIGISRRTNDYHAMSRYNELFISYKPMVRCIDCLSALGFLNQYKGWKDRNTGKGFQTRIKATETLIKFISEFKINCEMVHQSHDAETIIIRDKDKKPLEYNDNYDTLIARFYVDFINTAIDSHSIGLNVSENDWKDIHAIIEREDDKNPVDITKTRLHRVFNNSNVDADWLLEGGRFYGAWWLELPSKYRKHLLLDGKLTEEVDFSTLHPRILYEIEGIHVEDKDIYKDIGNIERGKAKKAINIILNAANRHTARIAAKLSEQELTEIEERFEPICGYFYSGIGLFLQNIDSIIAQEIMFRVIEDTEIALPVHDSMICKVSYVSKLQEIMEKVTAEYLHQIPVKLKQSREERVRSGAEMNVVELIRKSRFVEGLTKQACNDNMALIHTRY